MTLRAVALIMGIVLVWGQVPRQPRPAPLPRPMPDAEVLFVGDCAAWGFSYWGSESWALLGPRTQNLGLPSYRAAHLVADLHRLEGSTARLVVVHIGAADVSHTPDPVDVANGILAALEGLHRTLPQANVLVLELLDRRDPEMQGRTQQVNAILRSELAYSAVWERGYLLGTFLEVDVEPGPDGVHLDAAGYELLELQIEPYVDRLRRAR